MPHFDTISNKEDNAASVENEQVKQRLADFVVYLLKRFILFISFGPGILGIAWLIGRYFKR